MTRNCFQMKCLLEKVFDETVIESGSIKNYEQTHGDIFFTMFKSTLAQYCVTTVKELVSTLIGHVGKEDSKVCNVLTATIDIVTKDRALRKK